MCPHKVLFRLQTPADFCIDFSRRDYQEQEEEHKEQERGGARRRREFIRNDSQCRKVKRKMRRSWSARASRALQLQKFSGTANGNFDQRRRLRGSAQCRSCKLKRARRLSAILPHMLCRHTCGVPPHMRAGNSVSPQDRRGMSWSAGAQCVLERCRTQPSTGTALYDTFGQR
jgi:hypothetical protein